MIGEQSCVLLSQSQNVAISQSRKLNHHISFEILLCPMHSICKHQSTFSVSVIYFDSVTFSAFNYIARSIWVWTKIVLNKPNRTCNIDCQLFLYYLLKSSQHTARSLLIQVHWFHSCCTFDIQTPSIKANTFTYEGDILIRAFISLICQISKHRFMNTRPSNRM